MFSISFLCRESKCDKRGYAPVECSIIFGGRRSYMSLPRKERPEVFRREYSKRGSNDIKVFCDEFQRRVNVCVSEMYRKGLSVSPDSVKAYLRGQYTDIVSIGMLVQAFLGTLKVRVGINLNLAGYKKYEKVCRILLDKLGRDSDVKCLTKGIVLDILSGWKVRYEASSLSCYWSKLKCLLTYAVDSGYMDINPCSGIRVPKGEKKLEIMGDDEYERLRDKEIDIARVERVRDFFLFACNSGLSYCDCCSLVPSDFSLVDGRVVIDKCRQKTGTRFYSVVLPDGVKVLEKYGWD